MQITITNFLKIHNTYYGTDQHSLTVSEEQTVPINYAQKANFFRLMLSYHFTIPVPSSSLPSAPRPTAEASWNIQSVGGTERGQVREKDVKMQCTFKRPGSGPIVFRVTSFFLSDPPEVSSLSSGCLS